MTDPRAQHNRNPNSDGPRDYPDGVGGDCPFCGESYGQLPAHLQKCEEKPE